MEKRKTRKRATIKDSPSAKEDSPIVKEEHSSVKEESLNVREFEYSSENKDFPTENKDSSVLKEENVKENKDEMKNVVQKTKELAGKLISTLVFADFVIVAMMEILSYRNMNLVCIMSVISSLGSFFIMTVISKIVNICSSMCTKEHQTMIKNAYTDYEIFAAALRLFVTAVYFIRCPNIIKYVKQLPVWERIDTWTCLTSFDLFQIGVELMPTLYVFVLAITAMYFNKKIQIAFF